MKKKIKLTGKVAMIDKKELPKKSAVKKLTRVGKLVEAAKLAVRRISPIKSGVLRRSASIAAKRSKLVLKSAANGDVSEARRHDAEEAKYYPRPNAYMPPRQWERDELPLHYARTKIVLMARDPHWIFSYWEVTDAKKADIEREARSSWDSLRKVIRVYEITNLNFDGTNANRYFDIDISSEAVNWYIRVGEADKSWCADLGVITPDGRFIVIARSNVVATPPEAASSVIDEEWMSIEEDFLKLYGLWGGFAGASLSKAQVVKLMKERLGKELASGAVSSVSRPAKQRGFWMVVNTELIVYGATEPDATVTVQDKPIKLNKDGTFSLRFSLPDGEQVIPVKGVSADKEEERVITPIVKKHTK